MRFLERPGCHLCDDAWAILESITTTESVRRVNIDADEHLVAEFGLRIPVLLDNDGVVLAEGRFDPGDLRRRLG